MIENNSMKHYWYQVNLSASFLLAFRTPFVWTHWLFCVPTYWYVYLLL